MVSVRVPTVLVTPLKKVLSLIHAELQRKYITKGKRMMLRERIEPFAQLSSEAAQHNPTVVELAAALWKSERELRAGIKNTRMPIDHTFLRTLRSQLFDLVRLLDTSDARPMWLSALEHVHASKQPKHPRTPVEEQKESRQNLEGLIKYAVYIAYDKKQLGVLEKNVEECRQELEKLGLQNHWHVISVEPFYPCSLKGESYSVWSL